MAEISYTKTNWVNNVTKLNADNMNHIENGIETLAVALNTKASVDYVDKTHYGYSGDDLLIIPEGTTTIEDYAYENTNYKCVVIPNSVTDIGFSAFSGCTGLTSITIPDSVTGIAPVAFSGCTGLTSITIGNGVTSIGDRAFYQVPLNIIDLAAYVTESFPTLDMNNFNSITSDCQIKVIKGRKSELAAMTNWSEYADHIVEVETADTAVTTAENYTNKTHYGYSGSDLLIIPEGTTTITDYAYAYANYKCVVIPDSVTSIGSNAFNGCLNLTSITIPDSVTSIGEAAFYDCISLTSITIPDSVTSIGSLAFIGCTGLTSITILDSVTSIGDSAFERCTGLTSIAIPNSVTSIGSNAFYDCPLETIDLIAYTTESFPALGADNFNSITSDCQIKVVKGRKSELAAMTNWSAYADHIVEVPTIETVDAALETKLDKLNVVQTTGQSATSVMSQKATTDEINALKSDVNDIKSGTIQQTPLFANSVAECTDTTKLYVLPDGYIYAYINGAWTSTGHAFVPADYIVQTTGQSATSVMSQKAVTDELYSEVALTWENGSINGSSGIDAESTSTVCRALGYFDVRTIHSISVIKAKQLFYYDENKKYIGTTAIAKNSTIYKADILALGDVGYIRLRSAWGESAETVDKVTFYEDVKIKTAIEQSDKVDEKCSAYTIKECPMNWKPFFYNVTTGACEATSNLYFVSGDRIRLSEFIKAETGNKLYFRIYVYADDGSYIGYLGDMARGGTLYQKDIYSAYSNASEIILSMYYSSNIVTPVADVKQYTTVYCTATATERATEDYWRKQRQRFNDKPIMIAYSQTDLGYINTELAYVNHAIAGFRWLKGDVQPTSDGKLIMCHDDGFTFDNNGYITAYNATSENTRAIHDMTYEECMASEYAQEYHIRTEYGETTKKITYRPKVCDLEKFLIVCKEYEVRPYIVIRKNYMDVVVPELLRLLEAYDFLDNCIVNSFELASVAEVARQSNHRVMISVVKEYAKGTALTIKEIDNLLAVSPNCTINAYTGSTTTAWNNTLLADASKNAIKYAKSLGVVVGTAFVKEPQPLFERGIGLMQCSTLCVPMKVTPINLCVSLKDGVATVVRKGAYGAEFTADVAISGKKIQLYNIRKIGSTRDFSDGVTPYLAGQMPYSITAIGDNVTGTNLAWYDVIEISFDTNISDLDTSSEKRIFVKFAYGI